MYRCARCDRWSVGRLSERDIGCLGSSEGESIGWMKSDSKNVLKIRDIPWCTYTFNEKLRKTSTEVAFLENLKCSK